MHGYCKHVGDSHCDRAGERVLAGRSLTNAALEHAVAETVVDCEGATVRRCLASVAAGFKILQIGNCADSSAGNFLLA